MASPGRPIGSKNNPVNSAKHPHLKMTWKRAMKLEKIARLSIDPAGYSNEQIGNFVGCDKQTVVLIRQTPQYHAKMLELASGITSVWDQELRTDAEAMRDEMKSMVPSAMTVIRDTLLSKNQNLRFKAATEILNREGTLAAVSKTQVAVHTVPDMAADQNVVSTLMSLLSQAPKTQSSSGELVGGFTISAENAAVQQKGMSEDNNKESLEALDAILKDSKPN